MRSDQVRLWTVLFLMVVALFGCTKQVDGASDEAFKASIAAMKEGLSEAQQEELTQALTIVAMKDLDLGAMMSGAQDAESMMSDARRALDGKDREEIVAWAEAIRARREAEAQKREQEQLAKEVERAKAEVDALNAKRAQAEQAARSLAAFTVEDARFYKQTRRFGRPQPILELKVTNGTPQAVSRAYFKGTLKSPGRSVPWLVEDFNYEVSGGLEPNESQAWRLAPNMFSDWGEVAPDADAILHVEVTRLDGADGQPLFDASGWGVEQEERLKKLADFVANPKLEE